MTARSPLGSLVALMLVLATAAAVGERGSGCAHELGVWTLAFHDGPRAWLLSLALAVTLVRGPGERQPLTWVALAFGGLGLWDLYRLPDSPEPWPGAAMAAGLVVLCVAAAHLRRGRLPVPRRAEAMLAVVALLAGLGLHHVLARIDRFVWIQALAVADVDSGTATGSGPAPGVGRGPPTEATEAPARAPRRADVLLIVVDTLRADAASAGLPFLSALADRSLVLEDAQAPAPWTVPSMGALLTGVYPARLDPEGRGRPWARPGDRPAVLLPDGVPTLAEHLSRAGYTTTGLTKSPFLAPGTGFERGFGVYRRVWGDTAEGHSAAQLVDAAFRWGDALTTLRRQGDRRPWFLSLHFMDPHVNYAPPEAYLPTTARDYDGPQDGRAGTLHDALRAGDGPSARDAAHLHERYRGEVAYLDDQLARLFDGLADRGLLDDDTLVVFTADHGEQFGEHGGYLHGDLHTENVAVPLWISGAGVVPERRAAPASLVDVVPTVLGLLGLPPAPDGDGRSALQIPSERVIFCDYGDRRRLSGPRFSLLVDDQGGARLYDRADDPSETRDVAADHPELVAELLGLVEAHLARPPAGRPGVGPAVELDLETLRRLGYF